MTIELYVFPPSPRAFKAMALANHLGLDVAIHTVDLTKDEHKTPQYAALNPNMRMPTLKDGDFVLWESNAILQYLAGRKPDSGLVPRDERARLDVTRWQFWDLAHWDPACTVFIFENIVKSVSENQILQVAVFAVLFAVALTRIAERYRGPILSFAESLTQIVVARLLQGFFGAALVPLSQAVMLDIYPPAKHGSAMAVWGVGVMIGPIMGPALGGYLTENFDWRWVFFINVPIGAVAFYGIGRYIRARPGARRVVFDVFGFTIIEPEKTAITSSDPGNSQRFTTLTSQRSSEG